MNTELILLWYTKEEFFASIAIFRFFMNYIWGFFIDPVRYLLNILIMHV